MRKKLFALMALVMVLVAVAVPASAGPPEEASGTWIYEPVPPFYDPEVVGCNTVIPMHDAGTWTGTFVGTETEYGILVMYCNGNMSYKGYLTFDGSVEGRSGTLEMRTVGTCCHEEHPWEGTWTILSGTDDLENLRGHGTWFGDPLDLEYDGNYHFEPE